MFAVGGETVIDEQFEIGDGVDIPEGRYRLTQVGWFANTSRNRPVVLSSNAMLQWVYEGTVHTINGTLEVTPTANLGVNVRVSRNIVDVPNGSFVADVVSTRLSLAMSTRLFADALVQYNDLDGELSANVRVNFIHRPGSDLYLVFNERRGAPGDLWAVESRAAIAKLTYLARF